MPAAVRETRNPQSTSAHQSRAVVQLYLVTPLRCRKRPLGLAATRTAKVAATASPRYGRHSRNAAGYSGLVCATQAFSRWRRRPRSREFSSPARRASIPAPPATSSCACVRARRNPCPKFFRHIPRAPPKPIDLQAQDPELVGARPAAFHQRAVIFHEAAELGTHVETSPLHARPNLPRLQVHRLHLGPGDFWQRIAQAVVEANLIIGPWRARQPGLLVRVKVGQDLAGTVVKRDERTGAWPLICSDVSCAVITQAKRSKSGSRS
jgi:hypothetical protein